MHSVGYYLLFASYGAACFEYLPPMIFAYGHTVNRYGSDRKGEAAAGGLLRLERTSLRFPPVETSCHIQGLEKFEGIY